MNIVPLPEPFNVAPFYTTAASTIPLPVKEASIEQWLEAAPFAIDIAASIGVDHVAVYQAPYVEMKKVFTWWEDYQKPIQAAFSRDDKEAAERPMQLATSALISLLYWIERRTVPSLVQWQEHIEERVVCPFNAKERLHFIATRPRHYASFIQLNQLYKELAKSFAAYIAKQKHA
ncbi:YpoC family protein [Aureibacillus halotolerans]|uniref:YpoC-like domain-containing protein n=1 Tax=Aureibacillus halotolerans TaxID=1508390 RepID=A0A4R6UEH7_9BACI|nr:hypothetical protein [Aureibacillus halotolerans]TDQ41494.1 hypothetical protein EV213_10372 [Aureibacillus halotolerans]